LILNRRRRIPLSIFGDFQTTILMVFSPFLPSATGAAASNQKERDQKQQRPCGKNRGNQNSRPQRHGADSENADSIPAKHICHAPLSGSPGPGFPRAVPSDRVFLGETASAGCNGPAVKSDLHAASLSAAPQFSIFGRRQKGTEGLAAKPSVPSSISVSVSPRSTPPAA